MEKFFVPGQLDQSIVSMELRDAAEKMREARKLLYKIEQKFLVTDAAGHDALRGEYARAHAALVAAEQPLTERRHGKLQEVKAYDGLLQVALWEFEVAGHDTMGSFPIFTGGLQGSPELNLARAHTFINYLAAQGYQPWSQIPYLDMNLSQLNVGSPAHDPAEKFKKFYEPLIASGKIQRLVMMDGWDASRGCTTEHDAAERAGVLIEYGISDGKNPQY